jgi:hypothetical protein
MKPSVEFQPNGALCHRCLEKLDFPEVEDYQSVRDVVNLAQHSIYGDLVCTQCMLPHERRRFNINPQG